MLIAGCSGEPDAPDVSFGEEGIDFARLEHEQPLTDAEIASITPENLGTLSQEQVDQIYGRLSAGVIPDGAFDGALFFPQGVDGQSRVAEIIGGRLRSYEFAAEDDSLRKRVRKRLGAKVADFKIGQVENLGAAFWKGKIFYRDPSSAQPSAVLRNRIEDKALIRLILRDEDAEVMERPDVEDENLFFPAKVYCGQSLLDGRRESIIIDYAFSDELPGYVHKLDHLAGRAGLQIRDEIRMIRPGFYLGRAYIARAFVLNFTLYNEALDEAGRQGNDEVDECYIGPQREALNLAQAR
jgi:hypothetical protein